MFKDGPQASQNFNIANRDFGMKAAAGFLDHLAIPLRMATRVIPGGQPVLSVQLRPVPESGGFRRVVAVVAAY